MTARLPVAMVGAGHIHSPGYLRWLAQSPDVDLVGVYDQDPRRAAELAEASGTKVLGSLEEATSLARAAVIGPEPTRQLALAEAVAQSGGALLIEKPLGVNAAESKALVALAEKVPISVTLPVRYHPGAVQLARAVHEQQLGEVVAIWATNRNRFPGGWFGDPALAGGGCLLDHVVHVADLIGWIWQTTWSSVRAEAGTLHHVDLAVEDSAIVLAQTTNDMMVSVDPSMSRPDDMAGALDLTMRVWGERGVATIDIFAARVDAFDTSGRHRQHLVGADMDGAMLSDWVRSVRGAGPPPVPCADAFRASALAFAAQQAVATHQTVRLS
ncbi:MAG: Gfo/Idh/MocA family oxidoreductase [Actinomycetota bacterium]|nr:Gfo/Idh/MocA family oxidoreductase [Actinomycetota bacterium]